MHRLFAIVLLSGAVAIGCAGNTKASSGSTEQLARTPSVPANQNQTGKATPRQTSAYESEATGGSVLGGGTSETATGTPGVPEHKTWSQKAGADKSVTGANVSNTGHSSTPAGTQGAPKAR